MNFNLNLVKKHLNIEEDFTEDDLYITHLYEAAYLAVQNHIDFSLDILSEENGGNLPSPLLQAILLLVANYYSNRESYTSLSVNKLPQSVDWLLDQYKCYYPCEEYKRYAWKKYLEAKKNAEEEEPNPDNEEGGE